LYNNCQSKEISNLDLGEDIKYIGSIFEGEFDPEEFYYLTSGNQQKTNLRCAQLSNEIIIYGKKDKRIKGI
jgi:hypothetical protein